MGVIRKNRGRPEGRAHRARLAQHVLPGLAVGARLPKGICLARLLGIAESEASRHLHRMLAEVGIATETRARRGIFVISMPEGRA